jgi:hypothetical protein
VQFDAVAYPSEFMFQLSLASSKVISFLTGLQNHLGGANSIFNHGAKTFPISYAQTSIHLVISNWWNRRTNPGQLP